MTPLEGGGQYCDDCNPAVVKTAPTTSYDAGGRLIDVQPPSEEFACFDCGKILDPGTECDCEAVRPRSDVHFGGFFVRAAAYMADWLILGAAGAVIAFATNSLWAGGFAVIAAGLVCFAAFWIADGATPGKMLFGLKVRMINGESVDPVAAVLRYAGYLVSGATLGIGFLIMLFNEEKRGLHDMISNTVVIVDRGR